MEAGAKSLLQVDENICVSALHAAASRGKLDTFNALIEKDDAAIAVSDAEGRHPLHLAVASGHDGVVQACLREDSNTEMLDNLGRSPLHYAALCDYRQMIVVLCEHNFDVNAKDTKGFTPFAYAQAFGHAGVCEGLLKWDAALMVPDGSHTEPDLIDTMPSVTAQSLDTLDGNTNPTPSPTWDMLAEFLNSLEL